MRRWFAVSAGVAAASFALPPGRPAPACGLAGRRVIGLVADRRDSRPTAGAQLAEAGLRLARVPRDSFK